MSPKSLDVLLISRYGLKKTNALVREFSNNVGEVTDKEGIATVIKEMYWSQWIKGYDALNKTYDILNPYHMKITSQQTDDRDINITGTENETVNNSISNTSNTSANDTVTNSSTVNSTNTNSGSDTSSNSVNENRSNIEVNNVDSPYENLGTTHEVTNNKTDTVSGGNSESVESQAPYDTSNMKDVSKVKNTNNNTETSSNTMSEHTLDKSYSKVTDSNESSENSSVKYGKVTTVAETNRNDGTTESTTSRTDKGTSSSTTTLNESKGTTDDLSRHIETNEEGSKWSVTNQELIEQEFELRKKNLYNNILKDVVKLLTLSIY